MNEEQCKHEFTQVDAGFCKKCHLRSSLIWHDEGFKEGRQSAIEEIEKWLSKELTMHDLSKGVNYILKQNLEIKLKAEKERK